MFNTSRKADSNRLSASPDPIGRTRLIGWMTGFLAISLLAEGCSHTGMDDHPLQSPAFAPESFFNGALTAHGVVKDYSGTAIRHFNADITACWKDGVGTLDERFIFDDGEEQTRIWTLTPSGNQHYIGTAGDVVGEGKAEWRGNALFLDYTLRIELEDGPIDVHIDDRMYRVSDNVVINESKMRKFGFGVGEILLTLIRHPEREYVCPN